MYLISEEHRSLFKAVSAREVFNAKARSSKVKGAKGFSGKVRGGAYGAM
jgi:hypothetical protein